MRSRLLHLLTVDVWDTLLRRRCPPDAVKLHLAKELLIRYPRRLRGTPDARALLALRLQIEREQAKASQRDAARDDEYTLDAVLSEWIERSYDIEPALRDAMVVELRAEELAHEAFVSYPDPEIRALIERHPAKTRLFLSDFYATATDLRGLLDIHGLIDLFEGGHTSADLGINKRSGRLFRHLHQERQVAAAAHLHIGDNPVSDVRVPRRLGVRVQAFRNRAEEGRRTQLAPMLADRTRLFRHIERELLSSKPEGLVDEELKAYRAGQALAPLFAGFALSILENARRDQVQRLLFFSREGEFFIRCYQRLIDAYPRLAGLAPAPEVFEVSRLSTFTASLSEPSTEQMRRLWRGFEQQSIAAWAASLNADAETLFVLAQRHGLSAHEVLAPMTDCRVANLLADVEARDVLQKLIDRRRSELMAYWQRQGLADLERVAVVDIGWRGSIQDHLALLLPNTRFHGYYLGLQAYFNPQPANAQKSSYGPNLNAPLDESTQRLRLFRNLPLMEMLAYAGGGSVLAYEQTEDAGLVVRRREQADIDTRFAALLGPLQAGILKGVSAWAPYLHDHAVSSGECRPLALQRWAAILDRPPRLLERALTQLPHDESFGRGVSAPQPAKRRRWFG